jgi:hypothetical protein
MSHIAFTLGPRAVTIGGVIVAIAVAQFIAFALWSGFSRAKFAKTGMRSPERALMFSSAALLVVWLVVFDVVTLIRQNTAPGSVQASAAGSSSSAKGSCASLTNGMRSTQIRAKVGEPDQVIPEDDVRGPGAEVWVYKDRCAAHVFENTLEFVE